MQLGLDAHLNERTILGVSVSGSKVELNYTNPGPAAGGNYDLDMTSVHPYLGWSAGGLDFWATLGYGEGELEISADGAQADIPSSDLSMQTLGLGANGVLMATGATGDTYRLGLQWQRSKWFDLKLVAEREAGQITADHRIYIEGEIVF